MSAFAIDYCLLILLTETFGINYLLSATLSFSVSVIYNYMLSVRFVFSHNNALSRSSEFFIFVILAVSGLAINNALIWSGVEMLAIDYRIIKVFVGAIVGIWNFVTRKLLLERGRVAHMITDRAVSGSKRD